MALSTIIICPPHLRDSVFPDSVFEEIQRHSAGAVDWVDPTKWESSLEQLRDVEVVVATWGLPRLEGSFLNALPRLRAVFYAAGSVKGFVTDEMWARGIVVSSAAAANGIPVAEYTLATILLSLKRFWHFSRGARRSDGPGRDELFIPGCYRSKVGLVSMGVIGTAVARLLKAFEVEVLAYDPFLSAERAAEAGVRTVALDELFAACDVVSLHAPWIPETEGLVNGTLIASMKPGATLINTSRGAIIVESKLCEVLTSRPDLTAVLDVTYPEPPASDSPLRSLENVVLTPHIAGSMQGECARMGMWMAGELERFTSGVALRYEVTREMLDRMA